MNIISETFASSYKTPTKFFFWYPPNTPKSEKVLLTKIDFFILTYGCTSYFAKWLDQANLSNAYFSGMKEDLSMYGTQYNIAATYFQIGAILGGIPTNLLLTWIPPRFLLPGLELIWAVLTICTFRVKSYDQLYPLRFFIGFLEGSSFAGIQYILGSWYKRNELGKRTAIFACAAYVGTMVSGYVQSGVLASLDGKLGIAAWRWVFVIDGLITVLVAMFGFVFFPDTPVTTTAFYFSEEDKKRCVQRLVEDDRQPPPRVKFSWNVFRTMASSWQLYVLTMLWMFWNTTVGKVANTVMQAWLEDGTRKKWSLYQVNNIPTAINGWNIVMIMAANVYVDATGRRMTVVMLNLAILLFGTICLIVWEIFLARHANPEISQPLGLHVVSYMFAGMDGPLSPIYMSWANIICSNDSQVRALTIATMNSFGAALTTVIQQFLYPMTDAPKYGKGFRASLGFTCGMVIWVIVVRWFEIWHTRKGEEEVVGIEPSLERVGDGIGDKDYYVKSNSVVTLTSKV